MGLRSAPPATKFENLSVCVCVRCACGRRDTTIEPTMHQVISCCVFILWCSTHEQSGWVPCAAWKRWNKAVWMRRDGSQEKREVLSQIYYTMETTSHPFSFIQRKIYSARRNEAKPQAHPLTAHTHHVCQQASRMNERKECVLCVCLIFKHPNKR